MIAGSDVPRAGSSGQELLWLVPRLAQLILRLVRDPRVSGRTKSVLAATSSDVGVETDDIMTARVGLTAGTYIDKSEQVRFWQTLVSRIQSQPGITHAAVANSLPGHGTGDGPVSVEGRDYGDNSTKPFVNHLAVSPSYFDTFRIAPVQGRLFDARDTEDSMPVIVINEFMARRMFPDESPIGKRIIGTIRATARRVDLVETGGKYVEPVFGRPRRMQGTVIGGDDHSRTLIVDAGMPIHCTMTDPRQIPSQFARGSLVSFDVLDGATFSAE